MPLCIAVAANASAHIANANVTAAAPNLLGCFDFVILIDSSSTIGISTFTNVGYSGVCVFKDEGKIFLSYSTRASQKQNNKAVGVARAFESNFLFAIL